MSDRWADWLLEHRFGGSAEQRHRFLATLAPIRDRVLDLASITPGETVLDVGCGDGLLAFAALDRVGAEGKVIFSDVSATLLGRCRALAAELDELDRCEFVAAALPRLNGIADSSADVVVLRSVLIYVEDKEAAFGALHRVLRPGGRLSLFEPINSFGYPEPPGWLWGVDVSGLEPLAEQVKQAQHEVQGAPAAMVGFDERDLLQAAAAAGFGRLELQYEAKVSDRLPDWSGDYDVLRRSAPNPNAPTRGEVLEATLPPLDRDRLEGRLRAGLAAGRGRSRSAAAYLVARRP